MFWNIAHMKGSSFHTHITPCPCHFFPLVPHAIRAACRLPCCKIFQIHVLHKALVFFSFLFFYHCLAFQLLCVGVTRGVGSMPIKILAENAWHCWGNTPFAPSMLSWQLIFIVNPLGFFAFLQLLLFFRESLFTLKRIARACVCVFIA